MFGKDTKRVFLIKKIDSLYQAREYAFLLLKYRPRSESEFYQRLKKKEFAEAVIKQVLSFLKDKGFIDDVYFAKTWVDSRIKKPLGLRRLEQELRVKGISQEIIDNCLSAVKDNYSEEEVVLKIINQKLEKLKGIDPEKAKARIYRYLIRRGFSPEVVEMGLCVCP